jgi:putative membrane protein
MFELILFIFSGTILGTILGLIPGMHINNVLPILLTFSFFTNPLNFSVFIVSTAVSQLFISYVPSIFIGAPEEDTALSVLPGHKLLLEGRGYEAVFITVLGGIVSVSISLFLILIFSSFFPYLYKISRPYVHYLLIYVIFAMIVLEKDLKTSVLSLLIVLLSGLFGTIVLNSTMISNKLVLFPVLSGLFGLSTLLVSVSQNSKIPKQKENNKVNLSIKNLLKCTFLGSFAGIIVGFLPAIGVSQAAIIMQYIGNMQNPETFLLTLSSINISNEVFSLISLFLVGNPRSGASVAIERILQNINLSDVLILIGSICMTASLSSIFTISISRRITKFLERINYRLLSLLVIIFITSMIFYLTGLNGLLVAFTATSIGFLCNQLGIKRSHCMGVLLVPSIFFFAGLNPLIISILKI